jgi:hypothetical protein
LPKAQFPTSIAFNADYEVEHLFSIHQRFKGDFSGTAKKTASFLLPVSLLAPFHPIHLLTKSIFFIQGRNMNHSQDSHNRHSIVNQFTAYKHKSFLLYACAILLLLLICSVKPVSVQAQSDCLIDCQAALVQCLQSGTSGCQAAYDRCVDKCLEQGQFYAKIAQPTLSASRAMQSTHPALIEKIRWLMVSPQTHLLLLPLLPRQ